jgi:hypothetical protein
MTFITHGFRVSVVSDVRERVRDFRITFALYVKKILIAREFSDARAFMAVPVSYLYETGTTCLKDEVL